MRACHTTMGDGFWKQQDNPKLKEAFRWNQVGLILEGYLYTCGLYIRRLSVKNCNAVALHCRIITIVTISPNCFLMALKQNCKSNEKLKKNCE